MKDKNLLEFKYRSNVFDLELNMAIGQFFDFLKKSPAFGYKLC